MALVASSIADCVALKCFGHSNAAAGSESPDNIKAAAPIRNIRFMFASHNIYMNGFSAAQNVKLRIPAVIL
jgi:hypothetical protein